MLVSLMAVYRLLDLKAESQESYGIYLELFDRLDGILRDRSKTNLPNAKQQALSLMGNSNKSGEGFRLAQKRGSS